MKVMGLFRDHLDHINAEYETDCESMYYHHENVEFEVSSDVMDQSHSRFYKCGLRRK